MKAYEGMGLLQMKNDNNDLYDFNFAQLSMTYLIP